MNFIAMAPNLLAIVCFGKLAETGTHLLEDL
jgi:hypothetical protein